ncbi:hypothetical protein D9Q98_003194 [Chlorella vulgaris]|uniref:Uncharacterized protein n=1 Tax=Chlorella vulgaris TaxID=3077 RepID=A0A9D4TSA6_CHLVU|nr:hypothetical protein D9Q98_003194 [Chlorella vulgaris]
MEATSAATGLNVMVFNLQQGHQFDASNDDIQYFDSITCDGITFGVWAFCSGTFTNEGDGGYINWAFRGSFTRDPPDSSTVVFDNVC